MAFDSLLAGPLLMTPKWGPGGLSPSVAAAMGMAYVYDSATGEFAVGNNGDVVMVAAEEEITVNDYPDTTAARARIVGNMTSQLTAMGVIQAGTELTAYWIDVPPAV